MWAKFILPSRRAAQKNVAWRNHEWHIPRRVNWILWILIVPTFFCIEIMRANTKVRGIVTGQSAVLYELNFTATEQLELLYAREDLEVASLVQFTAIYAFTRLISSLLEKTDLVKDADANYAFTMKVDNNNNNNNNNNSDAELLKLTGEYRRLISRGGFLGLWVYIVAGCIRAIVTIFIAVILQFRVKEEGLEDKAVTLLEKADESFQGITSTAFGLLTVISVINMVIMSGTDIVTDKIGNANKKFLGARVMLLASEIAPKVIDAFEENTELNARLKPVLEYVPSLHMNRGEAEVLKRAILSSACLLAVIMNLVFWKDVDINAEDERGLLGFPTDEEAVKTIYDRE